MLHGEQVKIIKCCWNLFLYSVIMWCSFVISKFVSTYLGLDNKRPVSSYSDLLLHDAEPVEPADEQTSTVQPQGEVHVVTGEAVLFVLDVLTPVDIEEEEVMKVTSGEGLPLSNTWWKKGSLQICVVVLHCIQNNYIIVCVVSSWSCFTLQ